MPPGRGPPGCRLAAEEVLLFGNALTGTPLMQSDARVGIELPLRMLVWEEGDGTRIGYRDPRALALDYELAGHEDTLERMSTRWPRWRRPRRSARRRHPAGIPRR